MPSFRHHSWRIWPVTAAVLALVFIAYGIDLVQRSRSLQQRIEHEVRLLDELSEFGDVLQQLALVHRVDVSSRQYKWAAEMERVRARLERLLGRFPNSPGMDELEVSLPEVLDQIDSLHAETMLPRRPGEGERSAEAILHIMMQRAQKNVDRAERRVHELGLASHTATLSDRWNEAQFLLISACLMAVVFAWLVGMSNRLLLESRDRAAQLDRMRTDLQIRNRELQETMLSKEEKEVMIKEIHHRVKNNLQIVKSLIRFQMEQVQDGDTRELFNECVNRVSAMALVHEQTYLSSDLANIDVGSYLDALIRDLIQAYSVGIDLKLDIDIRVRTMGLDTLVPLGLLINEVISNSFKHAFKGRTSGTIIAHLESDGNDGFELRIGDDGIGLPSSRKWENPNSLGMELIHTLATQLDARITLLNGPGTVFSLSAMHQDRRKRA